jgi:hypothetical protein
MTDHLTECLRLWPVVVFVALSCYGFAWVIGSAKISVGLRGRLNAASLRLHQNKKETASRYVMFVLDLIECPGCLGFWEGVVLSAALQFQWLQILATGLAVATSNLLLEAAINGHE